MPFSYLDREKFETLSYMNDVFFLFSYNSGTLCVLGKCSATELAVQPSSFLISFLLYPIKVRGVFILKYSRCADKITYCE